jgi:hypothetical protein
MLHTTQNNYQALAKLYKEQTQMGFSKMLPQIALGQSQSFILNTALFENNVLHLSEIMIPPLMSSTMSVEDLQNLDNGKQDNQKKNDGNTDTAKKEGNAVPKEKGETGRPKKDEGELSDKTIQNKESMN